MILRTKFLRALGNSIAHKRWLKETYGNWRYSFVLAMGKPVPTVHKPLPPLGAEKRVPFTKVGQIWECLKAYPTNRQSGPGKEFRIIGYEYPNLDSEIPTHIAVVKRETPSSKWSSRHYRILLSDLRPHLKRYELRFYPSK